jgi:hypothetical protein
MSVEAKKPAPVRWAPKKGASGASGATGYLLHSRAEGRLSFFCGGLGERSFYREVANA